MKDTFKILDVGNMYFPVRDWKKEKKFNIVSTIDIKLDIEKSKELLELKKIDEDIFYRESYRQLWEEIKKEKEYLSADWICPMRMLVMNNSIYFTIDLLKESKK